MSDFESELSDSMHFAQAGTLSDPSLGQLRDQIKKVMIPLLIKTFQYKLELNQSLALPSRLQSQKNLRSPEEIVEHLKTLDNDLKVLLLWCQSCRSQIQKALVTPGEEQKNNLTAAVPNSSDDAISKSFSEAVSAQSSFFQHHEEEKAEAPPSGSSRLSTKKNWWKKFIGR
jgi:hypothetical protein